MPRLRRERAAQVRAVVEERAQRRDGAGIDMREEYVDDLARASAQGWLSRFFGSVLWPL